MRLGFKVWDSDTHIQPTIEAVSPYYDAALRARLPELEPYKVRVPADDGRRSTPGS